jgi:hypothetical protein
MSRALFHITVALLTGCVDVFVGASISHGPSLLRPTSVESKTTPRTLVKNFRGVSFGYDAGLATDVRAEVLPELLDGKPGDIVPEYRSFTLRDAQHRDIGWVRVFPVARYRESMTIYSEQQAEVTVPPTDWVPYLDDQVRTLRILVKERPLAARLARVLDTNRVGIGKGQMPFLPLYDACMAFDGAVKYLSFQNGSGVGFLTQWDTETAQITNDWLTYVFQGITNDTKYYVSAEFRIRAPFLPRDSDSDVMAWNERNYLLPHASREYQDYLQTILPKLEALPSNKFEPNLALFEHLIQSIKIDVERPGQK